MVLKPKISIKIRPKNPGRRLRKAANIFFKDAIPQVGDKVEADALAIIKRNTPARTGVTRDAWRSFHIISSRLITITLTNPLPTALFLNRGTKPSVGRFIPDIHRRIKIGIHPGIIGTKYVERSGLEIQVAGGRRIKTLRGQLKSFIDRGLKGR